MPQNQRPHRVDDIQTGKTLPNRVTSYSPSDSRIKPERDIVVKPAKAGIYLKLGLVLMLLTIFLFAVTIGVWDARNISRASRTMFGSSNLLSLLGSGSLNGSDRGRVNLLLVGYSIDDPGHPGATLTDSLILLSMNTLNKTGYMLSIPRDLYVNIPGFGYAKINEAYNDGGINLLERVVNADFRVPIDYYALINYTAVRDTVNALSGISVTIQSQDPRGLYDSNISLTDGGPLKLANGPQTINGQTALNLTRARGDSYDSYGFGQADFDRTQHQRQVLTAIKAKLSWKLVLDPRKNSQILDAIAANVKTDVQAQNVRAIFGLFNSIPGSSLQSLSLRNLNSRNYLASYTTVYGQSALIPAAGIDDYSQIDSAISQLN